MDDLQHRIERKISEARNPVDAAEFRAERAMLLVRHGHFSEVEREIASLRGSYGDGNYPRISILILLTEGLCAYYRDLSKHSLDRLLRASLLCKALKIEDLSATASSWLAHLYYNFDQYGKLADAISDTLQLARHTSHAWIPRLTLVIADTLQFSGEWNTAGHWYRLAQRYATLQGDRITLGAVIFNRVAVGLSRTRADQAAGCREQLEERHWTTEVNSAGYFHGGLDIRALPDMLVYCKARAAFVDGDYDRAGELYRQVVRNQRAKACGTNDHLLNSEIAMCQMLRGHDPESLADTSAFEVHACDDLAVDDRMLYHANLAEIWKITSPEKLTPEFTELAAASKRSYLEGKASLKEHLERIEPQLSEFSQRLSSGSAAH